MEVTSAASVAEMTRVALGRPRVGRRQANRRSSARVPQELKASFVALADYLISRRAG